MTRTQGRSAGARPAWARPSFSPAQILVMGFAGLILVGALLLALPASAASGASVGFVNALFTSTSAVCVTGLIVLDTARDFSPLGQGIIMGLIQAGGLGIVILSTSIALLTGKRISLRERVVLQEALGQTAPSGVVRLARDVIRVTLIVEGIGTLILFLRFLSDYSPLRALWLAAFHTVSAFNNAGFDLFSTSVRGFATDPLVVVPIGLLIFLGGIGFTVIQEAWRHRLNWSRLSLHSRMVLTVSAGLILVGTLLFLGLEWSNPETFGRLSWPARILAAWFTAVTPRTAGFEIIPTGSLHQASLFLTCVLMYIGASPASTGGGIKTTTFAVIGLALKTSIRGEHDIEIQGRRLPGDVVYKAWVIVAISLGWLFLVTTVLLVTEGKDLAPVLFETVSAFGTVGLSTGLTPSLTTAGKLIITLMMYTGRVGPLTLAVALAERRKPKAAIQYPDERVMIG